MVQSYEVDMVADFRRDHEDSQECVREEAEIYNIVPVWYKVQKTRPFNFT